jgi:hypothetical protein
MPSPRFSDRADGRGSDPIRCTRTKDDYPRCHRVLQQRHITLRIARKGIDSGVRLGRYLWVVERTLSWLNRYRRLEVRDERRENTHQAFLTLGCALIGWNFIERFC